jgi:elongator complex protein 3
MKELVKKLLEEKDLNKSKVERIKKDYAKEKSLNKIPLNSEILEVCNKEERDALLGVLRTKPTRTISGVSVIAVMTEPRPCPGKCTYCPTWDAPKSYTGYEPSAMRSRLAGYDPGKTVKRRLEQLNAAGHTTEKNELIIQGGTFLALPEEYQEDFIKKCYDAFNDKTSKSLEEAKKINETAKHRVVGLTIETRPDMVDVDKLLKYGCTRVELGVQSVYDDVLKGVKRGHTVEKTVEAFKILKDSCFKINAHIMPGLPGSSFERDLEMFKTLFEDPRFKPDMIKIYPCLVIEGSELYEEWKAGKFKGVDEDYMVKLLTEVYKMVPKWCRIMRVQRDIPAQFIKSGPIRSNLREIVESKLTKEGIISKEIRFREVGRVYQRTKEVPKEINVNVEKYESSTGNEYFICAENEEKNVLFGFLRLRFPSENLRPEINSDTVLVRELHVYGLQTGIGKTGSTQHKGIGKKLMEMAENIARQEGKKKIVVISGVGVKDYYKRKLGYKDDGPYVSKEL